MTSAEGPPKLLYFVMSQRLQADGTLTKGEIWDGTRWLKVNSEHPISVACGFPSRSEANAATISIENAVDRRIMIQEYAPTDEEDEGSSLMRRKRGPA